jgi:CRISPR-associated protein Cmr5
MMRNLEQIRAQNAFAARESIKDGKGGGDPRAVAKKVPAQIITNGFLGALAFAIEDNGGYLTVFNAIIAHLHDAKLDCGIATTDPSAFLDALSQKDAATLRAITAEAMAYLNYLRRFVKAKDKKKDEGGEHAELGA